MPRVSGSLHSSANNISRKAVLLAQSAFAVPLASESLAEMVKPASNRQISASASVPISHVPPTRLGSPLRM